MLLCERTCASWRLGCWQACRERSCRRPRRRRCVSVAVVWGRVTQRQVVCTCVGARARVPPRVGGLGPVLCACAPKFPVSNTCLDGDAPSRCLWNPYYASLFEAAPSTGFPCHHSGLQTGGRGSGEPALGFQTGEEEGRGQAGPSPASIPRGPGRGTGGGGTPALPISCPAGRPLPQLPLPWAARALPARRRGPSYG